MTDIRETEIPGLGVRYEFDTESGQQVSVVAHRTGRKEVSICDREDPDRYRKLVDLSEKDAMTLAETLGVSRVAETLSQLQQQIEGLAIDWLPLRGDSPYVGRTIGDARIRTRTGVSVVAVVRGGDAVPAPGPEYALEARDYLVVVGTQQGIEEVVELLHDG